MRSSLTMGSGVPPGEKLEVLPNAENVTTAPSTYVAIEAPVAAIVTMLSRCPSSMPISRASATSLILTSSRSHRVNSSSSFP